MCGATAFVAAKALVRLRSSIRRQVASSVSRSEPAAKPPTAPTRMSTRPRATTVRSTKAVIAARSVTSTGSVTRRPRSAGVARSHSWSRSFATAYGTATTAPSVRNRSVTAWPRAPVPPVTIATRCCSGARAPGALGGGPETRCGPARLEPLRQGEPQELVHASQDRRERPAREPLVLLVEEAERDEVGGLELGLPALLGARGLVLRERPVHADDLERFLLEVVRLLDVEGEDLEDHRGLDDEDRRHGVGPKLVEHRATVVPVGRPVHAGLRRDHHDRVHEAVEPLDRLGQALDVGRREVALIGAGLDALAGQEAEDLPVIADRLLVDRERRPAVALDLRRQRPGPGGRLPAHLSQRSEEHTSEL